MIVHGVPPSTLRRPAARGWPRRSPAALVRRNSRRRDRRPWRPAPTCWRRNWRSRAMPRSLSTRCSSEWKRDGALAGLGLEVAGKALVLLRRQLLPQLAALARAHAAQLALLAHAAGDVDAKMRVVDRQGPADRFDPAEQARARRRRRAGWARRAGSASPPRPSRASRCRRAGGASTTPARRAACARNAPRPACAPSSRRIAARCACRAGRRRDRDRPHSRNAAASCRARSAGRRCRCCCRRHR